jgi:hypothetical protein
MGSSAIYSPINLGMYLVCRCHPVSQVVTLHTHTKCLALLTEPRYKDVSPSTPSVLERTPTLGNRKWTSRLHSYHEDILQIICTSCWLNLCSLNKMRKKDICQSAFFILKITLTNFYEIYWRFTLKFSGEFKTGDYKLLTASLLENNKWTVL